MERGSGRTTRQMIQTRLNGVYIWLNGHLDYPRNLARSLNREDLKIVSPDWLSDHRWRGTTLTALTLDHACRLTDQQFRCLDVALTRVDGETT